MSERQPIYDTSPSTAVATKASGALVEVPANATPTQLLWHAIDKGMAPEQLAILAELEEKIARRQAEVAFANAFAAFQRDCPPIKHTATANVTTKSGSRYSYTYAPLDEVDRVVKPMLAQHGLSYGWDVLVEGAGKLLTVITTIYHELGHSRASRFTVPTDSDAGMSPQQKFAAASQFAQRRGVALALGITTSDSDPDEAQVDPTPITEDQATEINDLIDDTKTKIAKVLEFAGVDAIAKIRAVDYQRVKDVLLQKRNAREARA